MKNLFEEKEKRFNFEVNLTKEQIDEFDKIDLQYVHFQDKLQRLIIDNHKLFLDGDRKDPFSFTDTLNKERLSELKTNKEFAYVPESALNYVIDRIQNTFTEWFIRYGIKTEIKYPDVLENRVVRSFRVSGEDFKLEDNKLTIKGITTSIVFDGQLNLPNYPSKVWLSKLSSGEYKVGFFALYSPAKPDRSGSVGIGIGYNGFAYLSTGDEIKYPEGFNKLYKDFKHAQKSFKTLSENGDNTGYIENKIKRLETEISVLYTKFTKEVAKQIADNFKLIGIEGESTYRNKNIAKSDKVFYDTIWKTFINCLINAVKETKRATLVVFNNSEPRAYKCSKTSALNTVSKKSFERKWICPHCPETHLVDKESSLNILKETEFRYKQLSKRLDLTGTAIAVK